jgi:anti-sigma B factor antagonist
MIAKVEAHGDVRVILCAGKITLGAGDDQLRQVVDETLTSGARAIVIDLSDVTTIDSSGLGEVVASSTTAMNRNVICVFTGLPAKLLDLLKETQLWTVLLVFDTPDDAIAAISAMSFDQYFHNIIEQSASAKPVADAARKFEPR